MPRVPNELMRKARRKARRRELRRQRSSCTVYGLWSEGGELRYIGQTRCELSRRLKFHLRAALDPSSPVERWVAAEVAAGRIPSIQSIETDAIWDVSEVIWIDRHRSCGAQLLNVTLGGRDPGRRAQKTY